MSLRPVADIRAELAQRWHSAIAHQGAPLRCGRFSGIKELDALLEPAGIPVGRLTEITGACSSGKTGLALSLFAACLSEGGIGAYVDPAKTFFAPFAISGSGVDLRRLIIVRPQDAAGMRRGVDALVRGGACAIVVFDCSEHAGFLQAHHCTRLVAQAEKTGTALIALSHGNVPALAYFASLRLRVAGIIPLWQQGDDGSARLLGYRTSVGIVKSRAAAPGRSAMLTALLPDVLNTWPTTPHKRMDLYDASDRMSHNFALFKRGMLAREPIAGWTAAGGS